MRRNIFAFFASTFLFSSALFAQSNQVVKPVPTVTAAATLSASGVAQFSGTGISFLSPAGQPAIPYQVISVALPSNADPASITVSLQNAQLQPYPGLWNVAPMQPDSTYDTVSNQTVQVFPPGATIVNGRDVAIYGNNAFFPASLAGAANMGSKGTSKFADIPLALFQYNPVTLLLQRLVSAQLVVNYTPLPGVSPVRLAAAAPPREGYAIITTDAINNGSTQLKNFAIAKILEGFNVILVTEDKTVNSFGQNTPSSSVGGWGGGIGDVAANRIQAWIDNNYEAMSISYVLLIGDPTPASGDVPMKMLWPRFGYPCPLPQVQDVHGNLVANPTCLAFDNLQDTPSDFYYSELSSDWGDVNHPGAWGMPANGGNPAIPQAPAAADRHQEVIVGRIPAYLIDENRFGNLDSILQKIIDYGYADPGSSSTNPSWRYHALLPMQDLALPNVVNSFEYSPGWPLGNLLQGAIDWPGSVFMYTALPIHPQTGIPVVGNGYPGAPGIAPPANLATSYANVANAWSGANPPGGHYGAVVWYTHGASEFAVNVFSGMDLDASSPFFDNPGVGKQVLQLNDAYPAHTFQASCWTAEPEDGDNLTYALLQHGGINTIGATRPSWYLPYQGYSLGGEYLFDLPVNGVVTHFFAQGQPIPDTPTIAGMAYEYSTRAFEDGMPAGDSLADLKQAVPVNEVNFWANYLMFNLYGDPSIGVYSYKVLINSELKQLSLTYPAVGQSNGGIYPITATFQNVSSKTIQSLVFQVAIFSGSVVDVENALPPGGVGAVVPASTQGPIAPGQTATVTFNIRLASPRGNFSFWVNAYDYRTWK